MVFKSDHDKKVLAGFLCAHHHVVESQSGLDRGLGLAVVLLRHASATYYPENAHFGYDHDTEDVPRFPVPPLHAVEVKGGLDRGWEMGIVLLLHDDHEYYHEHDDYDHDHDTEDVTRFQVPPHHAVVVKGGFDRRSEAHTSEIQSPTN